MENEFIKCKSCGAELTAEDNFCPNCGAKKDNGSTKCNSCGAELTAEDNFCPECGAKRNATSKKPRFKKLIILLILIVAIIAFIFALNTVIILNGKYNDAIALMNAGQYEAAISAFEAIGDYKDSKDKITVCEYKIPMCKYQEACSLYEAGEFYDALAAFNEIPEYLDSNRYINSCINIIEETQAKEHFAGYWSWGDTAFDTSNDVFMHEYNPGDRFYIDFEAKTITMNHPALGDQIKPFSIISSTVLATNSFRKNDGNTTAYWHFIDGEVFVSFDRHAAGNDIMPMVRSEER